MKVWLLVVLYKKDLERPCNSKAQSHCHVVKTSMQLQTVTS